MSYAQVVLIRSLFGCGQSLAQDAEFKRVPAGQKGGGQFTSGSSGGSSTIKKPKTNRIKRAQQAERGYSGKLSEKEFAAAEKVNKQEAAKAEKKAEAKKLKEASKPKREAAPKTEKAPAKKKSPSKTSEKAVSSKGDKQKAEGKAVSNTSEVASHWGNRVSSSYNNGVHDLDTPEKIADWASSVFGEIEKLKSAKIGKEAMIATAENILGIKLSSRAKTGKAALAAIEELVNGRRRRALEYISKKGRTAA